MATSTATIPQQLPFDGDLAVCLATYAQAAYEAPAVKDDIYVENNADKTHVTFLDRAYYEGHVQGLLAVNIKGATKLKAGDWLGTTHPYITVESDYSWGQSEVANESTRNPQFGAEQGEQVVFLLIRDLAEQKLTVKVTDDDTITADDLLGSASISLADVKPFSHRKLDVPLDNGGDGRVQLEVQFLPLQAWEHQGGKQLSIDGKSTNIIIPKPAVPQNEEIPCPCDEVARKQGKKQDPKQPLKPLAFIDHDGIDTQVWLFWDHPTRQLCLSWRGTEVSARQDILTDLRLLQTGLTDRDPYDLILPNAEAKVHRGFMAAYNAVHTRVMALVEEIVNDQDASPQPWCIMVTGHSLGGALATVSAYEMATHKWAGPAPDITCHTIGSPRVGNVAFAEEYNRIVPNTWRFANHEDFVTIIPRLFGYYHVGNLIKLLEAGYSMTGKEDTLADAFDGELEASDFTDEGTSLAEIRKLRKQLQQADRAVRGQVLDELAAMEMATIATLFNKEGIKEHDTGLYISRIKALLPTVEAKAEQ